MEPVTSPRAGLSGQDPRIGQLITWLSSLPVHLGVDAESLRPASSDASFRRYFRVDAAQRTFVIMDAPPDKEDCRPFLHVAGLLQDSGLNVPAIHAQDLEQGFLLLSDLGHTTYLNHLQAGTTPEDTHRLYLDALRALVKIQQSATTGLDHYDYDRFHTELALFPEWYIEKHCGVTLDDKARAGLESVFDILIAANLAQPTVLVHRDFHSPNLMITEAAGSGPDFGPNPGVIDFQDAVVGPITYDLASLLTDARTTWDEPQQLDWGIRYWELARAAGLPVSSDFAEFHQAYEWMGLQRNLRILGVFARLAHRDGKEAYLAHIPRVNAYVRQVAARYIALRPLIRLLDKVDGAQVTVGYTF